MSAVTVRNCIRYYQTAEEISANTLKDHCSQLISTHWVCAFYLSYSIKITALESDVVFQVQSHKFPMSIQFF